MRHLKTSLLLLSISFTMACNAQVEKKPQQPSPEKLLAEMDRNKDKKLSRKEAKGPLKADFDKIDVNKDGFLTLAEIKNGKPKNGKSKKPTGPRPIKKNI